MELKIEMEGRRQREREKPTYTEQDTYTGKSYTYHVRDQVLMVLEIIHCFLQTRFGGKEFTFSSKLHSKIYYLKKYYSLPII